MNRATPTTQPSEQITEVDVPGVPWAYYDPDADEFYQRGTRRGLGFVFWYYNIQRVKPWPRDRSST